MNIKEIQKKIKSENLDAVIITHNNHFLGQDIKDDENQLLKLTGFSGSAGTLIIQPQTAHLIVDGRYTIQAKQEVDNAVVNVTEAPYNQLINWIRTNIPQHSRVEINAWNFSIRDMEILSNPSHKINYIPTFELTTTAPAQVFEHLVHYAGKTSAEKISEVVKIIKNQELDTFFMGYADSVSWLTNLRSNALPHTPLLRAMALLNSSGEIKLYADNLNLPDQLNLTVNSISSLKSELCQYTMQTFGLDYDRTPYALKLMLDEYNINYHHLQDPCQKLKAIKNPTEINGSVEAHLRDGIALCKFLYWLDQNLQSLTELDISKKLHDLRSQQKNYYSDSFTTISAAGPNGAIVHYSPTPKSNQLLEKNSLLLLDSGAQYFEGTTDVTRTIAIGQPTSEMKEKFTYVLKAHIALANAKFPYPTNGSRLDAICREPLWQMGLDFAHGTGHGVGSFLNVHEGPQNISPRNSSTPFEANMIVSIEPGYYKEGQFGIRIENLAYISDCNDDKFEQKMQKFNILTFAPIDKRLIDVNILTNEEKNWINNYHQKVYKTISPNLEPKEKLWLKNMCLSL